MHYFAYGSNMDETDLEKWCKKEKMSLPKWKLIGIACLKDYELVFNYYSNGRKGGAANLMPKTDSSVFGLLFELNDGDLEMIRKKEGYPNYYNEIKVTVTSNNQEYQNIITYKVVTNKEKTNHQEPTQYYMDLIINNAKKHGFPQDYINFLSTIIKQA